MAALGSEITVDAAKFDPAFIPESVKDFNESIVKLSENIPTWEEVGAPKYREMRRNGLATFPKPVILPHGHDIDIPSRETGRSIPCRYFYPSTRPELSEGLSSERKANGIMMHIHGGGWVLMEHDSFDPLLQGSADMTGCATISVGYRLAPEHPFPAGPEDCYDVADWLITTGEKEFGGALRFIGGESAGAHLSALTAYHILHSHPSFQMDPTSNFGGLLLHYGPYDLSGLPSNLTSPQAENSPVLSKAKLNAFVKAFCPNASSGELKNPAISPLYEHVEKWRGRLPAALFTCGTIDPLVDDTVFMATKWMCAGGEAVVKLYPGACHGFTIFDPKLYQPAGEAWNDIATWIQARVGK